MKAVNKLAVMFSIGMLASIAVQAMTPEQSYIASCRKEAGIPIPIEVVSPRVGPQYGGSTVMLEFVVDELGKPGEITVKSARVFTLGLFVSQAVSQWQFKPAVVGEKPVPMKVELPVVITQVVPTGESVAAN
jgi:hypothetical protein